MAKKKSIKKTADNSASKESGTSFEESFAKVEEIVRKLEQGQIGLSESLEHYEKGVKHIQQCYQALDAAGTKSKPRPASTKMETRQRNHLTQFLQNLRRPQNRKKTVPRCLTIDFENRHVQMNMPR